MTTDKIISQFKAKDFKPVYWLEGDEEYFIDEIIQYAEHHILAESEAGFNLMVFYGKDADWASIINACRRYPMFSDKQVVIIKEGQALKDIERLQAYIEKPLASTILIIGYKNKKVDGRSKLSKILKEKGVVLSTKKLYDNELPEWTHKLVLSKGYTITNKALMLLVDHIGNDLSRLSNEIDKLALNLENRKNITEEDIEKYVGISKEFNVFELQHALASRNIYNAIRIIQYFEANPKAAPLPLVFPSLYNFFSKVLMIYSIPTKDEKTLAAAMGVNVYFIKDYMKAAQYYSQQGMEKILLLLHEYNLKSIGINDAGTADAFLLKEMVVKMMDDTL